MIIDLLKNSSPDEAADMLRGTGIVRIENYIHDTKDLEAELMSIYDNMDINYQFGKVIRTDHQTWDVSKTPKTNAFFRESQWMYDVYKQYQTNTHGQFQKDLFSSYDFVHSGGIGPQGWSHFDKIQRLKFFLYVTDVDKDAGPLRASPGTQKLSYELRKTNKNPNNPEKWRFGRYYGDRALVLTEDWSEGSIEGSQNHYPEVEYKMEDIEGTSGTLVVFDSNVIHSGGQIKKGKSRLVARGHSW